MGASVTITGSNFNPSPSANIVYIGSVRAPVTAASATSLTVTIPAGTSEDAVTVTTGGLMAWFYKPFVVTFTDPGQFLSSAFSTRVDYSTGTGPQTIFSKDIDGDGKSDLIVADGDSNTVEIYLNTSTPGNISFALVYDSYTILPSGYYPAGVSAGDLDGDGKPDIVLTDVTSNLLAVFLNTSTVGNISLAAPIYLPQGNYSTSVTIGDLNGDGKPEIVNTNLADNTVSVYPNTSTVGNISFGTKLDLQLPSPTLPYDVVIGDFDGDGMPDLASSNRATATVSVFRNTGSVGGALSFSGNTDFNVGNLPLALAAGDLDGDGKPDLAVINYTDNTISLLHNTSTSGAINFVKGADQPTGNNPDAVTISDLDGDGKPDIAVANTADNSVSVLHNLSVPGTITVDTHVDYPTGDATISVVAADLDGDGMPDLAAADNNNGGFITVLRNQSPTATSITTFSPASGINGTVITITGTNFTGATSVTFGGTPASAYTVVSSTTITATVGTGTSGVVSVAAPAGTATLAGFTYGLPQPVVTSFSPISGTTGSTITILGSNLSGTTTVSFGGIAASSFTVVSDNEVTAVVASGATGAVNLTSTAGSSALAGFTYALPQPLTIYSFSPATGTTGTNVTIKGVGLSFNPTVSFGDVPAQSVTIFSDTMIIATVGSGASGEVSVSGGSGSDSLAGFTYNSYTPPPPSIINITAFTPQQGGAGTSVTISGTDLLSATGVSFGGVPAIAFKANSDTQIVAVVSNGASGEVKVVNTTSADSLNGFLYVNTNNGSAPGVFELVSFSGSLNGNKPQLQWTSVYDAGIAYYAVERGVDSTTFSLIDTVTSVKTGGTGHTYSFTDPKPSVGINYYRLKMQDTTTEFTYSAIISLQPSGVAMPVHPNPVKYGFFYVDVPDITSTSKFMLTNMSGYVLMTLEEPPGIALQRIDVPGLLPGTYQLSWTNGKSKAYQTILILPE